MTNVRHVSIELLLRPSKLDGLFTGIVASLMSGPDFAVQPRPTRMAARIAELLTFFIDMALIARDCGAILANIVPICADVGIVLISVSRRHRRCGDTGGDSDSGENPIHDTLSMEMR
ncbi:hypothetical protein HYPP_00931 [Hyphomicrobium sp. ghe19]|nr:hypothetical protein HYPP_00931 [Hyphomicrobium sp. ghe19]